MKTKIFLTLLLIPTVAALGQTGAAPSTAPYALISPAVAAGLKAQAATPEAQHLIKAADANLAKVPAPMPVIHTTATLPHQGIRDQSIKAKVDWQLMLTFAMAYRLTDDARYLQADERFFSAWLGVYKVSLVPIDETELDQVIIAYDLVRTGLSQPTQEKMTAFLHTMAAGYLAQIAAEKADAPGDPGKQAASDGPYNWRSHRAKLTTLAAYSLGDADLITGARQAFQKQIAANIKPDGSVVDFYRRDALYYVVYDLDPLTIATLAAKAHGEDWFHTGATGGGSVAQAFDWLTPYALGQKTHQEFVHSLVAFDAARAKVGEKGFSGTWNPEKSLKIYQLATLADSKYAATYLGIPSKSKSDSGAPRGQDWVSLISKAGF